MKACITGYGIVDCLGNNPSSNFEKLTDNFDYTTPIAYHTDLIKINQAANVTCDLPISYPTTHISKTMHYGIYATQSAIQMANMHQTSNVAVIVSSVTGGNEIIWDALQSTKRFSIKKLINTTADALCSALSQHYGFAGVNLSLHAACATGIASIDYGISLLSEYDYVIVGGSDFGINEIDMRFFSLLGALTNHACPFDDARSGFVMGAGAGVLILETEEHARKRNAVIHGYIYPAGKASDAYHRTAPSGEGERISMTRALQNANIETVDCVNAHGTSTPAGDEIEYKAIIDTIGNVPIYSNKGKIGHTMAAAGVIETIYSIEAMKRSIIPHNHNLKNCSFDINNNLVKQPRAFKARYTLNNSFGFGGKCFSQVIEVI